MMTIVMNNNPKDKKSVRIAIISFVSAFLIVLASAIAIATGISAVIDSLLTTNSIPESIAEFVPGIAEAFEESSKGILVNLAAASIFSFFPPLQKKIELILARRNNLPTDLILSPTKSTKRLIVYGTTLAVGVYSALTLFTSFILLILTYLELDIGTSLAVTFAIALVLVSTYPVVMCLTGEWIGRRSKSKSSAVLVAILSSVALGIVIWFAQRSVATVLADGIRQDLGFFIEPEIEEFLNKAVEWWAIVNGALIFLTVVSPLVVSAFRGAKYKMFYDLAKFYNRLPKAKKAEMLEYVQIIDDEFDRTYPTESI
jgi:hypothetical protein